MKIFLILSIACLVSCGKNNTSKEAPLRQPMDPQQNLASENPAENPPEEKTYQLKEGDLIVDFPLEVTEVTLKLTPAFRYEAFYKTSQYHLPIREYFQGTYMGHYENRPDVKCPVKRETYQNHLSKNVSSHLFKGGDVEFFFNDEKIQPEVLEEAPYTVKLDFRTLEAKRKLVIKNKTIQKARRYLDDKSECDWVIKQNKTFEVWPEYKVPLETTPLPNYTSFSIWIQSKES